MAKNARLMPRKTLSLGCPDIVRSEGSLVEGTTDDADDAASKFRVRCAMISRYIENSRVREKEKPREFSMV